MNLNSVITDIKKVIVTPIHKEGYKFIALFGGITVILALFSDLLGSIGLVLTLWCVYFFRNPERFTLAGINDVISPADGVVNEIEKAAIPPHELNLDNKKQWIKISVFLNVFDVHVNRTPMAGTVVQVKYKEGEFLSANADDASEKNERSSVVLKANNGAEIVFTQIAGLVARRIFNDLKEGDEVDAGELYGIIRFGSRTDIYLPSNAEIKTIVGQRMTGGETVIAELSGASAAKTASTAKAVVAKKAATKKVAPKKAVVKKAAPKKAKLQKAAPKKIETNTAN